MQEARICMTESGVVAYNTAKELLESGRREELEAVRAELLRELHRLKRLRRGVDEGIRLTAVMLGNVEERLRK